MAQKTATMIPATSPPDTLHRFLKSGNPTGSRLLVKSAPTLSRRRSAAVPDSGAAATDTAKPAAP
ncbi:hypothetical protein GCM10010302_34030 [Streptomyces polychromogenes]|uniref:Uncharacterized protein n=1 Tax=Streptomyces polychromogenes TaxID=67342 RepID=A0ABN0VEE2_9ACTN